MKRSLGRLVLVSPLLACSDAPNGPRTTVPTPGPLILGTGEVADVPVRDDGAYVRLSTTGGERLVVVLTSTRLDGSVASIPYSASLDDSGTETGATKREECALAAWAESRPTSEAEPSGAAPASGDTRTLRVAGSGSAETITVKAAAVGPRAIVWLDTTPEHPASLDASFISGFLEDFETLVLPRSRSVFGMESDRDGNGRIGLVFTPLTKGTGVAFFTGCDLAPLSGCSSGNDGEYLYLTPPAEIAAPYNTPTAIKETIAHELGHLLHFHRKVVRNALTAWPDSTYMIEGVGAFAQDVVGFQAGNFYVAKAGLEEIDAFSLKDVFGSGAAYDGERDGLLRGGAYWVVRYLYDRAGSDALAESGGIDDRGGPSFLRATLDRPEPIAEIVKQRVGGSLSELAADFYTALVLGSRAANPCFSFAKAMTDPVTTRTRGADPYASFHGQALTGPAVQPLASADGSLRPGGVEYLTVTVPEGQTSLAIRITVPSSSEPRVRVARLE